MFLFSFGYNDGLEVPSQWIVKVLMMIYHQVCPVVVVAVFSFHFFEDLSSSKLLCA